MEQLVVELNDILVTYGDQLILEIDRLHLHQCDRIGIVGENGSGKSTLINVLEGSIQSSRGQVHRHIDFASFAQKEAPGKGKVEGGWSSRLELPNQGRAGMSGGEQTRLKLAQLFSAYREGMLLDEPTTLLDEKGVDFLIEELRYYGGTLVIVSHDRYVLDQLVTTIWELKDGQVNEYSGNYTAYEAQKRLEQSIQQEQYEQMKKEKNRLLTAAEEKKKKARNVTRGNRSMSKKETKATANRMFMTKSKGTSEKSIQRAAKALEQRAQQLPEVDAVERERQIVFHQPAYLQLHNKVPIFANQLTLKKHGRVLIEDASFQFPLSKTIAITGENGSGKTSLLQSIVSQHEGITVSPNVRFGIYQQFDFQWKERLSVLAFIKQNSDQREARVRSALANMGFFGSDLRKCVSKLSGGESIRLQLCHLFLGEWNVLVLDEPTTFLDVKSMKALEQFIKAYEGTIILVSHDRTFLHEVADVKYTINNRKLIKGDVGE
ncbi:ribosomal protection-like ABC-F family protein [Shouchella lehensis]|uniref:ABC transported ATP-binding protein n=1 Tax=Shouchella lehensis G1 TaxID=1246626 RepID=A0A060LPF1_9BACI|nr:ABC-F type ribosomal protection protein [Shouchella lehensis]AIC93201.1 ABC transported ATP-binding protein [Shouchella lehensis G1]